MKLTLLPILAAAAVASADRAPAAAPVPAGELGVPAGELGVPVSEDLDTLPPTVDTTFAPPGMTEPVLAPPGLTPPLDCETDEAWFDRPECRPGGGVRFSGGVIRGGFGHYFWVGGG